MGERQRRFPNSKGRTRDLKNRAERQVSDSNGRGFFREPGFFDALKKRVFPRIVGTDHAPVRIWVPGCATGEEAYSLAISLVEYLGDRAGRVPIQIFGTDGDADAIRSARWGRYSEGDADDCVGPKRRQRFFRRTGEGYEVSRELRDLCTFARHDITRDPPFSRLDLLSCRGVLTRLEAKAQRRVVSLLHHALKPSGLLVTGRAEAIDGLDAHFTSADGQGRIGAWKPIDDERPADPRPRPGNGGPLSVVELAESTTEELQSMNEELEAVNDELQQRNAELAEARGDLMGLLSSLELAVVLVGRDLRIRRFTPTVEREWRLQPGDVGRPLADTSLGMQLPALKQLAVEAITAARPREQDVRDARGRWHSMRVRPCRSRDGAIDGAVVALLDIDALKRSERRVRAFVESAPEAMVIVNSGGSIELVNAQAERLFGYRREELVGRRVETLMPPSARERRQLPRYLKNTRSRPEGARWELVVRRKNGDEVPVDVSWSPIETADGTLVASTIRDATERRRLEERARRAAVLDERNRLAREVHDSLAQGLTAIVVQLEGAEEVLTSDPEESRRQILRARDLARHDLEEARRALLALRPGPLDACDLPEAIREVAAPLAAGASVEVEVSVRGRRGRLLPLLEDNLLRIAQEAVGNALKHGGASRVRADLTYAPAAFRMRIEDDGRGFEPRQAGSGGLGLTIMKERAERMGAVLRIRSGRSKGTRVDVRVPLHGLAAKS